jgi:hypothetical protein
VLDRFVGGCTSNWVPLFSELFEPRPPAIIATVLLFIMSVTSFEVLSWSDGRRLVGLMVLGLLVTSLLRFPGRDLGDELKWDFKMSTIAHNPIELRVYEKSHCWFCLVCALNVNMQIHFNVHYLTGIKEPDNLKRNGFKNFR